MEAEQGRDLLRLAVPAPVRAADGDDGDPVFLECALRQGPGKGFKDWSLLTPARGERPLCFPHRTDEGPEAHRLSDSGRPHSC